MVEDDEAVHDRFKRVVVLVGSNPLADGRQGEHVALPHDGHGDGQHPLDVEGADEEEDGEGPVLGAHHNDVELGNVVPPQPPPEVEILPPGEWELEVGDGEDRDDPGHGGDGPNHWHGERKAQDWSPNKVAKGPVSNKRLLVGAKSKSIIRLPHAHHAHRACKGDGKISGWHKKGRKAQPGTCLQST